jgi:glycerol uptake facilitator protein
MAELFGTCFFVQLGLAIDCLCVYGTNKTTPPPPLAVVAAVWGLAYTLGIYISAAYSGGHLNPAVSWSFALVRPADLSFRRLLFPYWAAQLAGVIIATCMNLVLFHKLSQRYDIKHKIVRGDPASISSAAAYNNYWR